jgi:hypothetical protein
MVDHTFTSYPADSSSATPCEGNPHDSDARAWPRYSEFDGDLYDVDASISLAEPGGAE